MVHECLTALTLAAARRDAQQAGIWSHSQTKHYYKHASSQKKTTCKIANSLKAARKGSADVH